MKKLFLLIIFQILVINLISSQDQTKITSSNLNLRIGPDAASEKIATIPKGTIVKVYDDCDCVWIPVLYDGKTGYVSSRYLRNPTKESNLRIKKSSTVKYYTNSNGEKVQSPTRYNSAPDGATALCRDGTYSFSRSRRGTCSHHGGVSRWL